MIFKIILIKNVVAVGAEFLRGQFAFLKEMMG